MKRNWLNRNARRLGCVLLQVLLVVSVLGAAVFAAAKGDHGEVAREMVRGLIGGCVGGVIVSLFFVLNKVGGA